MDKTSYRDNCQVKQDNVVYPVEGKGEALNDESNPLKHKVIDGKSGSVEKRPFIKSDNEGAD